ncbi:MAG: hypothetical protein WCI17_12255 [bacterium]
MNYPREFIGEALGTFVLVLCGCGAVVGSVLFQAHHGLMPMACAWGPAAFSDRVGGFFFVYTLAPLLGGAGAALFFVKVLEPAMKHPSPRCDCETESQAGKAR